MDITRLMYITMLGVRVPTLLPQAFRNNQSKYYVDGKTSNFTEADARKRFVGVAVLAVEIS